MADADVLNLADFGAAKQDIWRLGYRGDEVELFQRRLVTHGFTRLRPNGMIDLDTAAAVRVLQKHLGVPVSGMIDPDTRAALDADEVSNRAQRTRAAGAEFSTPITLGLADVGGEGFAGGALAATETPQQIQTVENAPTPVPLWKRPMFWVGLGGAALLYYYFTREEGGAVEGLEGGEGMGEAEDPEAFFGPPKRRRRRAPAKKARAARKAPGKKRRSRKKGLAETELGPDGAVTEDPNASVDLTPSEEDVDAEAVGNPPRPRRQRRKAAGKEGAPRKGRASRRKAA